MDTTPLNQYGYPEAWPKTSPRPLSVVNVISHSQKRDLYTRKITTRELALNLKVVEGYISYLFPGKCLGFEKSKKSLLAARREYRKSYAEKIIKGQFTLKAAAEVSKIPPRSLARVVRDMKKALKALESEQNNEQTPV